MNTIKVYGCSDDLIEFEGVKYAKDECREDDNPMAPNNCAEFSAYMEAGELVYFRLGVENPLVIIATYLPNATWTFTTALMTEDDPLPNYEVSVEQSEDTAYSTQLIINGVPEDEAVIVRINEHSAKRGQFDR